MHICLTEWVMENSLTPKLNEYRVCLLKIDFRASIEDKTSVRV